MTTSTDTDFFEADVDDPATAVPPGAAAVPGGTLPPPTPNTSAASVAAAGGAANEVINAALHSPESERMVLALMLNPNRDEIHHKLIGLLAPTDFFGEQNQVLWQIIGTLRDAALAADPAAVIDHANSSQLFVGGVQYVMDTIQDPIAKVCTNEAGLAAASRVKGFSMSRRLLKSLRAGVTLSMTGQGFDEVLSHVQDDLDNLRRSATSSNTGPQHARVFYDAIVAQQAAVEEGITSNDVVPTGHPEWDSMMNGGLPKGGVVILAGRPGQGKTALATDVGDRIALRGVPTLTFSIEMPGKQIAQRSLSRHSRIPFSRVKSCEFVDQDFGPFVESIHELSEAPAFIDETPGLTLPEIRSRARAFAQVYPNFVLILDYIQKIASDNAKFDDRIVVSNASKGLTLLCRELNVPGLVLAQLNRGVETRTNKRPVMADLKESGQIEQDANMIYFVYRDEYYNPDTTKPGVTELICGKNRDGATDTIEFQSDLSIMRYTEMGRMRSQA